MSRYKDHRNGLSGIAHWLSIKGIKTNRDNFEVELYYINTFCKHTNFKGSQTSKIIHCSENFTEFKNYTNKLYEKHIKTIH